MSGRVVRSAFGAFVATGILGLLLAASPWRPRGFWVALVVIGVCLPVAAALGVSGALRIAGDRDLRPTARLTAISSPSLVAFWQFALIAVFSTTGRGAQQVAAFALGAASAAALAARFTHPAEP